jgi:ABC-2 type transport system ATP-binding protein
MIVEASRLCKAYGSTVVLDGLNLQVEEGSVLALLGPNGAGKTTIVRILTTLSRPDGGRATVAGHDVVREAAKVRAAISLTGQYAAVDDEQTGRENLVTIGRLMIERFDLVEAMDRRVKGYSGGMRRRLDLAMSLVAAPRVIFLDEPTTGLDPTSRSTMWAAITELVRAGTTIVLTTQYLEEADRLADRIVLLDKGRVAASGTADALKAQVGGERVDLHFDDPVEFARAAHLLAGRGSPTEPERLVLSVASDGSAEHLHQVLDELRGRRIAVARVTSHRPTLDDVFLAVTAPSGEQVRAAVPA